jgi:DNA-binding CsgD family transcriptional regulator
MTPRHPPVTLDPVVETGPGLSAPSIPAWLGHVDQAAWVAGPDRRIRWMNRQAEALLGIRAADWVGKPCHAAVCARDGAGRPFCGGVCPITARAARREPLAAHDVVVGPRGPRARWARFTSIPVDDPSGGVSIVHLATDLDRERRVAGWMERVAGRSAAIRAVDARPVRALTARESEILDLLVDDVELPRVAHLLGISKTTVRNHVQRLLAALGAHSVQEAVAMRLLRRA